MTSLPPFREIAESTYDWEMWFDDSRVVRWINRAVERFLPATVESCLAMSDFPLPFVVPEDRERVREVFERASRSESGNDLEFRIVGRAGEPTWVSISFQPLVDGDGRSRGFRTSIRDIALRKEHERLVAQSERDAARRAEERTELLATLSHELRTPLHCIAGFTELLLDRDQDAKSRRFLELVADQSNGALRLVEDLLHFAAGPLREPTLRATDVDLDSLVEAQLESLRVRARPGVVVRFDTRLGVTSTRSGDPDRVRQIVANLVGNALRFTDVGEVVVSLTTRGDPEVVVLEVRDTGVGMDETVLASAKRAFFQGDGAPTSSRGGVGLGLAIVDQLATSLGGELAIDSEPGRGTRVRVSLRLPRRSVSDVVAPTSRDPEVGLGRFDAIDVLVVDDVEASRELIVAMLASVGVTARSARSGDEAIAVCSIRLPALILLDYHMPGRDGISTAEAIVSAISGDVQRPVIAILTANVLARPSSDAIDRWLTKPLVRGDLVRILDAIAGVTGVDRETERERPSLGYASAADRAELDEAVLADLEARPGAALSLLATKGRAMLDALDDAVASAIAATEITERRSAAHTTRGIAAMLGGRALERCAGDLERDPSDLARIPELEELHRVTFAALTRRIEAASTSA